MRSGEDEVHHSFDRVLQHLKPRTLQRIAWIGVVGTLVLTLASHLHLALLEFGPLRDRAIQVDELYFAACAARGTATGMTMAGCHDSKAPLIHMLYQAVQMGDAPYDIVAVKSAAFATVAIIVALVALLAHRFGGPVAAVVSAAMLLQALSADASVMAFKTDTVGTVFVLLALLLLTGANARRLAVWWWAGLCVGLAAVTKQTFALVSVAVIAWMATSGKDVVGPGIAVFVRRAGLLMLGVLAPFGVFLAAFAAVGRHVDYLASFFLYPSVYGGPHSGMSPRELWWRLASVLDTMADATLLAILFAIAAMLLLSREFRQSHAGSRRMLVSSVAVVLLVMLVAAPYHFTYHAVPAWAVMAILAGTVKGDVWPRSGESNLQTVACQSVAILVSNVLSVGSSWNTNGGRGSITESTSSVPLVEQRGNGFAYVLGTWPDFYVYNGLVPASDVMFPWALPGAPGNWAFTPPPPDSWRGRALTFVQARSIGKLFDDFSRTRPEHIVVLDDMARHPGSAQVTDVPGFDAYLQQRCVYQRTLTDRRRGLAKVYRCRA